MDIIIDTKGDEDLMKKNFLIENDDDLDFENHGN